MPADFAGKVNMLIVSFDTINPVALGIGVMSVLVTLFWSRITSRVPGSLIALLIGVLLVLLFGVNAETIGSRFGDIPSTLPLPAFPEVSMQLIIMHIGPAFTIAMLGSIESLLSAVVSDSMIGGRHRSNTELIAQGIANVGSGLFGGIPATGAIARTATNVKNGGRTPVAGIVHALVLLVIMLFAGKWAALIPLSVLAGILMVVAYNMSEWRSFVTILRGSRYDVLVLLTSFILTVVVDLTIAIQVGMVLAALLFMKRMADVGEVKPLVSYASGDKDDTRMVDLELPRNTDVFEISGPLFFGVANKFNELMHEIADDSDIIIIRMRNVPMIDATGIHNFNALLGHFIHKRKRVMLSGVNETVMSELRRHGIVALVGKENIFTHFEEALEKAHRVGKK